MALRLWKKRLASDDDEEHDKKKSAKAKNLLSTQSSDADCEDWTLTTDPPTPPRFDDAIRDGTENGTNSSTTEIVASSAPVVASSSASTPITPASIVSSTSNSSSTASKPIITATAAALPFALEDSAKASIAATQNALDIMLAELPSGQDAVAVTAAEAAPCASNVRTAPSNNTILPSTIASTSVGSKNPQPPPCRNHMRGMCFRIDCAFRHKWSYEEVQPAILFCNDFQNSTGCFRPKCNYVHATFREVAEFHSSGELPPYLRELQYVSSLVVAAAKAGNTGPLQRLVLEAGKWKPQSESWSKDIIPTLSDIMESRPKPRANFTFVPPKELSFPTKQDPSPNQIGCENNDIVHKKEENCTSQFPPLPSAYPKPPPPPPLYSNPLPSQSIHPKPPPPPPLYPYPPSIQSLNSNRPPPPPLYPNLPSTQLLYSVRPPPSQLYPNPPPPESLHPNPLPSHLLSANTSHHISQQLDTQVPYQTDSLSAPHTLCYHPKCASCPSVKSQSKKFEFYFNLSSDPNIPGDKSSKVNQNCDTPPHHTNNNNNCCPKQINVCPNFESPPRYQNLQEYVKPQRNFHPDQPTFHPHQKNIYQNAQSPASPHHYPQQTNHILQQPFTQPRPSNPHQTRVATQQHINASQQYFHSSQQLINRPEHLNSSQQTFTVAQIPSQNFAPSQQMFNFVQNPSQQPFDVYQQAFYLPHNSSQQTFNMPQHPPQQSFNTSQQLNVPQQTLNPPRYPFHQPQQTHNLAQKQFNPAPQSFHQSPPRFH